MSEDRGGRGGARGGERGRAGRGGDRPGVAAVAGTARSRERAPPRSNLIDELVKAREAESRSVRNLAEMAGVTPGAIRRLEAGQGGMATLVAVFEALPFQVTGLAPGRTFAEQLRNRRGRSGMSIDAIAAKSSLGRDEIDRIEAGCGSVDGLLRLLGVLAPRVRRRAPERAYWGPRDKVDRDSRFTPGTFMRPIYDAFGDVDLDPCAHPLSPVLARRRFFLADGDDGLSNPWSGRLVFVNPPFSVQLKWLRRAYEQWKAGNVETVLCLVPTRTDSAFFHETVMAEADVFLLQGRLPFADPTGRSEVTPFSLMLVAFGATAEQKARFAELVLGCWVAGNSGPGLG